MKLYRIVRIEPDGSAYFDSAAYPKTATVGAAQMRQDWAKRQRENFRFVVVPDGMTIEKIRAALKKTRKNPKRTPARLRPHPSEVKAARARLLKKHAGNPAMVKRLRARFKKADR